MADFVALLVERGGEKWRNSALKESQQCYVEVCHYVDGLGKDWNATSKNSQTAQGIEMGEAKEAAVVETERDEKEVSGTSAKWAEL